MAYKTPVTPFFSGVAGEKAKKKAKPKKKPKTTE